MKELTIRDLPVEGVMYTGEIGIAYVNGQWERNGQCNLCPLSKMVLDQQPEAALWINAASEVLGWSLERTLAFKLTMGSVPLSKRGNSHEANKGVNDAMLYHLLYKLARKIRR